MINLAYPTIDICQTGLRLKALRKQNSINNTDLAAYLHLSSPRVIHRWHAGECLPSLDHMYALSVLYDISMNEMIVRAEDSDPS